MTLKELYYFIQIVVTIISFAILINLIRVKTFQFRPQLLQYLSSVFLLFFATVVSREIQVSPKTYQLLYELLNDGFILVEVFILSYILLSIGRTREPLTLAYTITSIFFILIVALYISYFREQISVADIAYTGGLLSAVELTTIGLISVWSLKNVYQHDTLARTPELIFILSVATYCIVSVPFFSLGALLASSYVRIYLLFYLIHFCSLIGICYAIYYFAKSKKQKI